MSQYLNEGIFREHLAKLGVQVELSTEPVSIEQDETGVRVSLKHVGSDKIETVRCAYIIGADGARGQLQSSTGAAWYSPIYTGFTRRAIGATFEGQTKDADGQAWADVEVEGISSEVGVFSCRELHYTRLTAVCASALACLGRGRKVLVSMWLSCRRGAS